MFLLFCFPLQSEYLGEDGEWYFFYTGQEGVTYNMTHVFYATMHDRVNIAKIQKVSEAFFTGSGCVGVELTSGAS